jgi:Fur family ferric uptake transcriptional regulator
VNAAKAPARDTGQRRAISSLIAERVGHFTAADLLDDAHASKLKIGRATVFRTLDLLSDQGALERIDLPTGEHAYVACVPEREHHHHVVCRSCGRSAEVSDSGLQAVVERLESQSGFSIDTHRLELFGLCGTCSNGETR